MNYQVAIWTQPLSHFPQVRGDSALSLFLNILNPNVFFLEKILIHLFVSIDLPYPSVFSCHIIILVAAYSRVGSCDATLSTYAST